MASQTTTADGVAFRVLDAMDGPHSGRILRLRLETGDAPSISVLKGAELVATGPDGRRCRLRVDGFAVFGGKPSNDRVMRTGRVDVHVTELDDGGPVGLRWTVTPAGRS